MRTSPNTRSACARYYEETLPLVGSPDADLADALERQHYKLASWRTGTPFLNYRRFFDVSELAGVRVEDPDVFAASHALIAELWDAGIVDGLRVDHVDGLADPRPTYGAWVTSFPMRSW